MLSTPAAAHMHTHTQLQQQENANNVYIIKHKSGWKKQSISFFVQITEIPYSWYRERKPACKDDNNRTKEINKVVVVVTIIC